MSLLEKTLAAITPVDWASAQGVQTLLDNKTKPLGSLGRLEELACRLAAIRRSTRLSPPVKAVVVMAGDHGVAGPDGPGVSAFPQAVTAQMVLNFVAGGAAINVLAAQAGARVVVVDMGVKGPLDHPGVINRKFAPGTQDFTTGPAMSRDQAVAALEAGIQLAGDLADQGISLLAMGEMGIGNTTSSAALAAGFLKMAPSEVTGRGTGVDDAGLARKLAAITAALKANGPLTGDPVDTLAKLGGFEIAGLAGLVLGGAARNIPVVVDGFITAAAALTAVRLAPHAVDCLIPSHASVEKGHGRIMEALGLTPLFDMHMRLGEGSGAALAMMWVDAAVAILNDMATFDSAGVSGAEG